MREDHGVITAVSTRNARHQDPCEIPDFSPGSSHVSSTVDFSPPPRASARLADLPASWTTQRLKFVAPQSTAKLAEKPADRPYLGLEQIESWTGRLLLDHVPDAVESAVGLFEPGDVLFGKLRPYLAKAVYATFAGACTTELLVLRPSPVMDGHFLNYQLLSDGFIKEVDSLTYGAKMPRASGEQLGNLPLAVPPLGEQIALAARLDCETAKIDALIAKKQRLIALLQEKRASMISTAVTRGLDPDAPMRDSDIPWMGQVPAHWQVKRLKLLLAEPFKYGANEAAELSDPQLPRFIRITDIHEDGTLRDETFKSLPEDVARPYLLKDGDLLLARSGATVGKTVMYKELWGRACYAGYLIRARPNRTHILPSFLIRYFSSSLYWEWISSVTIQATIQNVSAEKYAQLSVPVPPLAEQEEITAFLDRSTAKIEILIHQVQAHIERLREYRTALISAAVTGKIDVRGQATP